MRLCAGSIVTATASAVPSRNCLRSRRFIPLCCSSAAAFNRHHRRRRCFWWCSLGARVQPRFTFQCSMLLDAAAASPSPALRALRALLCSLSVIDACPGVSVDGVVRRDRLSRSTFDRLGFDRSGLCGRAPLACLACPKPCPKRLLDCARLPCQVTCNPHGAA